MGQMTIREALGAQADRVIARWATINAVTIEPDRVLHGRSGARLIVVFLKEIDTPVRKVLIKVATRGEDAESESRRHLMAIHRSREYSGRHLVSRPYLSLPLPDGGYAMFQDIAGGNLADYSPISDLLGRTGLESVLRSVTRSLLDEWNSTTSEIRKLSLAHMLRRQLAHRLRPGGSVWTWAAPVAGLLTRPALWLHIDGEDRALPNPLAAAFAPPGTDVKDLPVVTGNVHGDLHLDNVLTRVAPSLQPGDYWLVDLASYRTDAPLSWDTAALMTSVTAHSLPRLSVDQRHALMSYLIDSTSPLGSQIPGYVRGAATAISATGRSWAVANGHGDDWSRHYLISLAGSALVHTGRASVSTVDRWWFFRLACHAVARLLDERGLLRPVTPVAVADPGAALGSIVAARNPSRPPVVVGQTPPGLHKPRKQSWSARTLFNTMSGRMRASAAGDAAISVIIPYLRVALGELFTPVGVTGTTIAELILLDCRIGDRPVRVAVQHVMLPRLDDSDDGSIMRCVEAIHEFQDTGIATDWYLLLHNQDHRVPDFNERITHVLNTLVSTKRCTWVGIWNYRDLMLHMWEAVCQRTVDGITNVSQSATDAVGELLGPYVVEDTPISTCAATWSALGLTERDAEVREIADPAQRLAAHTQGMEILLGEFGVGKTTAAVRAARTAARRTLFLPAARLSGDLSMSSRKVLSPVLTSLVDEVPPELVELVEPVMESCLTWLVSNPRDDLCLIVDGLDEAPMVYRRHGLNGFLQSLRQLRIPVIVSVRTEFWNSRQAELAAAIPLATESSPRTRIRILELHPWDHDCILALVDSASVGYEGESKERLHDLRELVISGEYERLYGDIPRRPLFLQMLIDDVLAGGLRERSRLSLIEGWIQRKILRDWRNPMHYGHGGRPAFGGSDAEDLDETVRRAYEVMTLAARTMTVTNEDGQTVLLAKVQFDKLRDRGPAWLAMASPTALVVQSVLLPSGPFGLGDPVELRFAHRAFHEFFLARSLVLDPDQSLERGLPSDASEWLAHLTRR